MAYYFFDTSAVRHCYIRSSLSRSIKRTISDRRNQAFISELTLVELATAFADECFTKKLGHDHYDRTYRKVFKDVATKRLSVREITQRDLESARHLVRFAKVIHGRHLKSADAIIAESCRELAYELGSRVTLYLCDEKLYKTLRSLSAYTAAVRLRFRHP